VFVENSGHYIQRDKPAVVIDAIRDVAGCNPR
jgi:pimeloyl-ACP methyl ester carboxylesterase